MMLKDKVAVIYGAGGAIGGAVARAFASEGAKVFVTGRLRAPVDAVAEDIVSGGGSAEAATIDALDEPSWMPSSSPCRSRPTPRRISSPHAWRPGG